MMFDEYEVDNEAGIAEFDQAQAEAVGCLRSAKMFFLACYVEDGTLRFFASAPKYFQNEDGETVDGMGVFLDNIQGYIADIDGSWEEEEE